MLISPHETRSCQQAVRLYTARQELFTSFELEQFIFTTKALVLFFLTIVFHLQLSYQTACHASLTLIF